MMNDLSCWLNFVCLSYLLYRLGVSTYILHLTQIALCREGGPYEANCALLLLLLSHGQATHSAHNFKPLKDFVSLSKQLRNLFILTLQLLAVEDAAKMRVLALHYDNTLLFILFRFCRWPSSCP
jgi:hypothetical protein